MNFKSAKLPPNCLMVLCAKYLAENSHRDPWAWSLGPRWESRNGKMSKMLQLIDLETQLLNDHLHFLTCHILSHAISQHFTNFTTPLVFLNSTKKLENIWITCQNHLWGGNHPLERKFSRSLPDYKWHNRYLFRLFPPLPNSILDRKSTKFMLNPIYKLVEFQTKEFQRFEKPRYSA